MTFRRVAVAVRGYVREHAHTLSYPLAWTGFLLSIACFLLFSGSLTSSLSDHSEPVPHPVPERADVRGDEYRPFVHNRPNLFASPTYYTGSRRLVSTVLAGPDMIGGIDYTDPVGYGRVPLIRVAGQRDRFLSESFRVRDFASRDGAPYARISDRLVNALERLRARAGSLVILSGYRHRAYNDRIEIGGVSDSQHIAGRAADVWSGDRNPLELAELALEALGCNIGLGLGPTSLHVDVRGQQASWTYPGAVLSESAFDAWVVEECSSDKSAIEIETALDTLSPPEFLPPQPHPVITLPATDSTTRNLDSTFDAAIGLPSGSVSAP